MILKLAFITALVLIFQNNLVRSEVFDDLLTYFGRENTLKTIDLDDITQNLLNKFNCNSNENDCDNVSSIRLI